MEVRERSIMVILVAVMLLITVLQDSAKPQGMITARPGDRFQLRINQIAFIESKDIRIKFLNVIEDSRCPYGVKCVWEGQVKILLGIVEKGQILADLTLINRAGHEDLSVKDLNGYSIRLLKVFPYPETGKKIEIEDYIIILLVEKT
jgi:hypothetical protein